MWFPNDEKIMDFSVLSSLFASFLLVGVENDDFCLRRGKNGEIFFLSSIFGALEKKL